MAQIPKRAIFFILCFTTPQIPQSVLKLGVGGGHTPTKSLHYLCITKVLKPTNFVSEYLLYLPFLPFESGYTVLKSILASMNKYLML